MLKKINNIILDSLNLWCSLNIFLKKKYNLGPILKRIMSLFKYKPMRNPIKVNNIFKMRHVSEHMLGA